MPDTTPKPDPMTEPEPMTPGTMDAPTVALTVVEPGTLAVSASGVITVTAATTPAGVTVPTVNASTGVVTVATTTTAGTYLVYGSKAGDILFAEYFYVTVSPADNAALDTAVAAGISNWGNTADLNYIVTTAVTDMTDVFINSAFNGDISGWDVSSVTITSNMFNGASAFNQNLEEWKDHWSTAAGTLDADGTYTGNKTDMFKYSGVTGNLIPSWY